MSTGKGRVAKWNDEKGFGFITPQSGGKNVFFHINDYSRTHKRPDQGLAVSYVLATDSSGRDCAVQVVPTKGHRNNARERRQQLTALILCGLFGGALFFLWTSLDLPLELLVVYGVMSPLTYSAYARDKDAARKGRWRTPENTLHIMSLLGGWPGAGLAQSFLRHKSKKLSFKFVFWITVIANCAALYWLLTPEGRPWLDRALAGFYGLLGELAGELAG